jgi:hypothetical protein
MADREWTETDQFFFEMELFREDPFGMLLVVEEQGRFLPEPARSI